MLLAEALDVEGVARDEMLQPLDPLRRADQPTRAAPDRVDLAGGRIDLARGVAAAGGADLRKDELFRALRPLLFNRSENLRDHVARPLHDHRVADPHVLPRDLILVMQGRVLHHDAAHGDGIELGDGRQRAGAAHLNIDVAQDGGRLLGGKFVGERPARACVCETQALLQVEAIDLVNDAVDIVAEASAALLDLPICFQHLLDAAGEPHQRIDRKAPRAQRLVEAPLSVGRQAITSPQP